jgi:lysyl-tRNA synthetase class I
MKKSKMPDITPVCEKCGKVATVNEKMSNENWIAYDVELPCECGGKFRPRCLLEQAQHDD